MTGRPRDPGASAGASTAAPPGHAPSYTTETTSPPLRREPEQRAARVPWQRGPRDSVLLLTVLRWGVVAIFVGAGSAKLLGLGSTIALFDAVGFGQWFRYVTGVGELTGAALLAIPRTTLPGALLLATLMIGAVGTEMFILQRLPVSSVATLSALGALAWLEIRSTR